METREIESKHFEFFRHFAGDDLPDGKIEQAEAPDFLIRTPELILGVEHTRVFKSESQLAALDSNADYIVDQALQRYIKMEAPLVYVRLFFNLRKTIKKKEADSIASSIARIVNNQLPRLGQSIELTYGLNNNWDQPREVDEILISRRESPVNNNWKRGDAVETIEDVAGVIQSVIDKKADLLTSYLEKCNRCWLLIVADFMKQAQGIRLGASSKTNVYISPFERTYFLDCTQNSLKRLGTELHKNTF